ncbi:ABC transporter substrate-binding protein [Micromonospora sp. STR1s_5]|nr:ABC transporter substrate-binding protein [Micromonospora sp. STR1s_5]
MKRRAFLAGAAAMPAIWSSRRAEAQVASDGVVKIGVLDDMSSVFSDQQGMGDYVAAKMAAEDFGPVLGAPVEVIQADLQNKTDIGLSIARRWIDLEKVDMILGLGNSAVALAVQDLCREKGRIDMPVGAGTTDLTGKGCSPYGVHWTYDTYSGAKGPVQTLVGQGLKKWFFITTDYAFGHSLEANASAILKASGGEIAGAVRSPLGEPDYSSHLLRASSSGAQVLGICAGGNDLVNIVKQMGEFGLLKGGMQAAALNCSMMNIKSIGLESAQGLIYTEAYYWDQNDGTRALAERFRKIHGRPPSAYQASCWGAVTHYLKAVQAAGTDATAPVIARMREMPVNDFMTKDGYIRKDGRTIRDMYLMRVKQPSESKGDWDLLEVAQHIKGEDAFRPLGEGGCALVK